MKTNFIYRLIVGLTLALCLTTQVNAGYFGELDAPANACLMGATSGGNSTAKFRALVGADLPVPSATTLGGVKSLTCSAGDFISSLNTSGVLACTTPAGSGSVSTVSVVTANGLAGTVANPTTTPAITLTTSVSGLVKGNGTALSAAAASDVTGQALTGFTAGAGVVAATDSILQAFNKIVGNITAISSAAINSLTGDVVASGPGAAASTIQANVVSNAKLAQMAAHTFKGNNTGSTANASDLTATQLTAELNQFTSGLQGLVPASGGGTTNFLRADGSFAAPPSSSGTVTTASVVTANGFAGTVANPTTTPAITLTTSVTGLVKGNGTALSAAAASDVTGQLLTGFSAGAGTISATDSILQGFNKVVGNIAALAFTNISGVATVAQTTVATQAISASTIDWSTGSLFTKTLSANTTFTFSNQTSGQTITVRLTNTASNYTVTWPGGVLWSGGVTPTQTIGAKSDVYTFVYDGSTTYGSVVQNF